MPTETSHGSFGPFALVAALLASVRSTPDSCHAGRCREPARWAITRHHSITSSARASSDGGISRPIAFATIRLTTRSNLAARSTGRSAGFAPAKSCRPSRRRAAEVDEGHHANEAREFLFFVADIPNADYLARCVLDRVITGHVRFAEDVDLAVKSLTFVDIHYRFSLWVQDGPKRPALYAARHIGGYTDIIITRLYKERSRAAGLSLDLVDNREVVVHLG